MSRSECDIVQLTLLFLLSMIVAGFPSIVNCIPKHHHLVISIPRHLILKFEWLPKLYARFVFGVGCPGGKLRAIDFDQAHRRPEGVFRRLFPH